MNEISAGRSHIRATESLDFARPASNTPLSALSSQRDIKAAPDNFCMFAAYSWQLSPRFPEIVECNVIKLEQMATSANLPNLRSFKGPVCRIYWDLLAEMEHTVHNYVFISE